MDEFLKQLQLSDEAIDLYNKSLGKSPLTYNEFYSLIPNLSDDNFTKVLNELKSSNLIVEIAPHPQKPEILLQYITIPPFTPFLTYYTNINANLSNIQDAVQGLVINSLNKIFREKERNKIELDTLYNQFQEIKKDISEDSFIQKQDVEEIVGDLENLKEIKKVLSSLKEVEENLHKRIKGITQTEFANLIKILSKIKTEINNNIRLLELKKNEAKVINIVEDVFKEKLNQLVQDFSSKLSELIKEEFKHFEDPLNKIIVEPINSIIDDIFRFQNDFKLLYLNVINDFEIKINKIREIIINNKLSLDNGLKNLENLISENLNEIIKDSINQVSGLNKPIENLMQQFLKKIMSSERMNIDNIWVINSKIKINEEILNVLSNSKEEVILIIPKIDNYLTIKQFQNLPQNLKVKIVSSEPHTNSLVKRFKEIPNIEFRTLKNENVIAFKGDDNLIVISVIQKDSKDPLNDNIGLASNYKPLINILNSIIRTTWTAAEPDFGTPSMHKMQPQASPIRAPSQIKTSPIPTVKSSISSKTQPAIQKPTPPEKTHLVSTVKQHLQSEIDKKTQDIEKIITNTTPMAKISSTEPNMKQISGEPQKIGNYISKHYPKAGDKVAMQINAALNVLLQQLSVIKGEDFSIELQKIADLILVKKGFSVILHDIRRIINDYKKKEAPLDDNDKNLIFDVIESWKQRLF